MSLDVDLQSELATLSGVATQENKTDEDHSQPNVVWIRNDAQQDVWLNGTAGLNESNYTVTVYGLDIDATASIADTMKASLNGFSGIMGSTQVLGCFVSQAADDYIPKELDADEGLHQFSFNIQILN